MPYYEGGGKLGDETPKLRKWGPWILLALGIAAIAVGAFALTNSQDEDGPTTVTAPPVTTTSTTVPPTTTAPPTTTPTTIVYEPGDSCTPGTNPDCIDPEENGSYVYLPGGGACLAAEPPDPRDCADNDGDGRPGPPVGTTT